jgi:hypothetical protein
MQYVEALLAQLANTKNVDAIRWEVVSLVREQLKRSHDNLDEWETAHLANAIGMLAMNVNALRQPTTAWLRLCLVDLRYARTPVSARPALPVDRSAGNKHVTPGQLHEALMAIIRQLDRRRAQPAPQPNVFRRRHDRLSNNGGRDRAAHSICR